MPENPVPENPVPENPVLQELAKMDDIAFSDFGYDRWSEDNQRSPKNDEPMLRAVEAVVGMQ